MSEPAFYIVWNTARNYGTLKHPTRSSAKREAERLSELHPGQAFVILQSIGHCVTERPVKFVCHEREAVGDE
jgi:hypothetical protein